MNSKDKGNIGEALALAEFIKIWNCSFHSVWR